MATYTITTSQNIDELTTKAGGDTYNVNGGTLTIDQDSRYGLNQTTSTSLGPVTVSATLGGLVLVDATAVILIPFNTGTGNVPASNTVITQSGQTGSGKLIGVWSSLTAAPTASGAAMPASGFLKIKQVTGTYATSGALTGIGANANGATTAGWIEIVGDEAATCTVSRLGTFRVRGAWYSLGSATGANTDTYQIPSSGSLVYAGGVWVETSSGSGVYEFYPCAGSQTALVANVGTEAGRGKVCWISTAGVVRFGHDGTNTTGGYVPASGCAIRIPNIFFTNCTTAARTANALPNATLATRYDFTTTGAGVIDIDKCVMNWYPSFAQPYSVALSNVAIATQLSVSEIAAALTWDNVGVGQEAANAQFGLLMSLCFAGGTISNCTWTSATLAASGRYIVSISDISGFTFSNNRSFGFAARGNATTGNATITRASSCTWTNCTLGSGRHLLINCSNLTYTDTVYFDCLASTTPTANPMYVWDFQTAPSTGISISGLTFAGSIPMVQPYSGIVNFAIAGCSDIKIRNMGSAASPLDLGYVRREGVSWSRTTTTATITDANHGLKSNDIIYVEISSDTAAITVAQKTVTVTNSSTFTFTALNAGGTTGTLTYYDVMTATPVVFAAGAAAKNVKIQRCYFTHQRTNLFTADNSSKGITMDSFWGNPPLVPTNPILNCFTRGLMGVPSLAAQTSVYGTHFIDFYTGYNSPNVSSQSWSRTTTTATVTSTGHKLRTGEQILVTVSSDTAAIVLGLKTVTATTVNAFTFTCLNAGGASGTLTFVNASGRVALQMNETTAETTSQFAIDSGTPAFTSAGTVYMPTVGQKATWTMLNYVTGHSGFIITDPVMGGGTITNHNLYYAIDINDGNGFSAFRNLYYQRTATGGTSGTNTHTVSSATGIAVNDYVFGTGIAPNAKVTNIVGTTITTDINNTATVSGTLRYNHLPFETPSGSLGFKLKIQIETVTTNVAAISSVYVMTKNTDTDRANQYPLEVVTVSATAKAAADSSLISGARVIMEADTGGSLPASASVTITRSGSVATVTHGSAHNMSNGMQVAIRFANQPEYNGVFTISNVTTLTYDYTVSGTPTTPATGSITASAIIMTGLTDGSGLLTSTFSYSGSNQPIKGVARKGTAAPYYKTALLSGTITSAGLSTTTFMVADS